MATTKWVATSANIRQVATEVIAGTWLQNDTITLAIDNVAFVTTIGTLVTTAQVATTLQQAYTGTAFTDTSASATIGTADGGAVGFIPEFSEWTATVSSSTVTFTANGSGALAGKPITMSSSKSSASGTATYTNAATASKSQWDASIAVNWSANATVANNDTIVFDNGSQDLRYNMSLGVQPATINKYAAYTGNVGLPEVNVDNSAKPYHEYRTTYLTTSNNSVTTTLNYEIGSGTGSGRFKWDSGAGQAAINVFGKGTRIESGVPCLLWKGTHVSNVVNNLAGDIGIAFFGGESATVATLITGDGPTSSANTVAGSGCTLTTVTLNGGTQETNSAITTANQYGGTWTHKSGTVTTANVYGGTHYPNAGATYTTLNLYGGTFDASKGTSSFTVTNTIQLYKGAKYLDPQGRSGNISFKLNGCSPSDVTIQFPANKTFTLS